MKQQSIRVAQGRIQLQGLLCRPWYPWVACERSRSSHLNDLLRLAVRTMSTFQRPLSQWWKEVWGGVGLPDTKLYLVKREAWGAACDTCMQLSLILVY